MPQLDNVLSLTVCDAAKVPYIGVYVYAEEVIEHCVSNMSERGRERTTFRQPGTLWFSRP